MEKTKKSLSTRLSRLNDSSRKDMLLSETLWKHLAEIDEECNEMMDRIVAQKKQPNFGWCGCFFAVFYFFWSAGYWSPWRWCWQPSLQYRQAPKSFQTPIVLTFRFIFHMYPLLRYWKLSKCTHFGKRRTATRFGNTQIYQFIGYEIRCCRQGGHKAEEAVLLHKAKHGLLQFFFRSFVYGCKPRKKRDCPRKTAMEK